MGSSPISNIVLALCCVVCACYHLLRCSESRSIPQGVGTFIALFFLGPSCAVALRSPVNRMACLAAQPKWLHDLDVAVLERPASPVAVAHLTQRQTRGRSVACAQPSWHHFSVTVMHQSQADFGLVHHCTTCSCGLTDKAPLPQ